MVFKISFKIMYKFNVQKYLNVLQLYITYNLAEYIKISHSTCNDFQIPLMYKFVDIKQMSYSNYVSQSLISLMR